MLPEDWPPQLPQPPVAGAPPWAWVFSVVGTLALISPPVEEPEAGAPHWLEPVLDEPDEGAPHGLEAPLDEPVLEDEPELPEDEPELGADEESLEDEPPVATSLEELPDEEEADEVEAPPDDPPPLQTAGPGMV